MVLLHLLRGIAAQRGLTVIAAHLDHGIRPKVRRMRCSSPTSAGAGKSPAVMPRSMCRPLAADAGISLEMAGRRARRRFLRTLVGDEHCDLVALAHHGDDQAETFLLRLLRGSGQKGLAGMRERGGIWWRPLLNCRRKLIHEYALANQLQWVEDASNRDPVYLRNRIRHQVIPDLLEINPQFPERLQELVRQNQVDDAYWDEQIATHFPRLLLAGDDGLSLDRAALLAQHPALRSRLIREALRLTRSGLQRIAAVHVAAIEALLAAGRSQAQLDLPGCWVARRYQRLWFRTEPPVSLAPYELSLPVPGLLALPCGRSLRATLVPAVQGESQSVAEFSFAVPPGSLRVRNWRHGDRFAPLGMAGHKRLKRFFGDHRVEFEERERVPLVLLGDRVLWIAGMRRSRHAQPTDDSRSILRLGAALKARKKGQKTCGSGFFMVAFSASSTQLSSARKRYANP